MKLRFNLRWAGQVALACAAGMILTVTVGRAAEVTTLWQETFYERYKDDFVIGRMRAVAVTPDGGFCLAGEKVVHRAVGGGVDLDAWAVRLDAAGAVVFDRTFGDDGIQTADEVAAPIEGGCTIAGRTPGQRRRGDVWLLRLGAAGDLLWERTLGGQETDAASAVAALPGGDTVVSTYVGRTPDLGSRLRVDRFGPAGELVWTRGPGELATEPKVTRIAALAGGHVLVSGRIRLPGATSGYAAIELDESGAVVWSATLEGDRRARAFVAVPGTGHAVASFDADARPSPTVRLRRFDSMARELWRAEAQLFDDDTLPSRYTTPHAEIVMLADGGFALLVERDFSVEKEDPLANTDHWLLVFDADGRLKARRLLGDGRAAGVDMIERIRGITATPDGAVIVGQTMWPSNLVEQRIDAWLRKLTLP